MNVWLACVLDRQVELSQTAFKWMVYLMWLKFIYDCGIGASQLWGRRSNKEARRKAEDK